MRYMWVLFFLSACSPVYVPADCQPPPVIPRLEMSPIDESLPYNEKVREIVIRFGLCMEHVDKTSAALDAYKP